MHTLRRRQKPPITGDTLWRNPTKRELKIRFMTNGGHFETRNVQPGAKVAFPAAWGEKTTKKVCKALVSEEEYQAGLKDKDDEPAKLEPEAPATEPLGDGSQPRTITDDEGGESDSERSSGDALEKFAQELETDHTYSQLQEMAKDLGAAINGKKIDVARRIAKAAAE